MLMGSQKKIQVNLFRMQRTFIPTDKGLSWSFNILIADDMKFVERVCTGQSQRREQEQNEKEKVLQQ